jgi:uncharacterized protein (DUF433 family)
MTPVANHIRLDERGVAWIDETKTKVIEVVLDHLTHGWSVQEIRYQHYDCLSLSQIHAALAYYFDHQAEMDTQIARDAEEYRKLREQNLDTPGRRKLRASGLIP